MKSYVECDSLLKIKDLTEIMKKPVVARVTKFDEESSERLSRQISEAHTTGQKIIPIIIDSYGGQAYSLLSMISSIQNSKLPVATIVEGKAMSCGALLFSFGAEGHRYMDKNAVLMIHDVSTFTKGKVEDIKVDAAETERLNNQLYTLMARNCGKADDYFLKIIHERGHTDWYLNSQESKEHNLCNHIRIPSMVTKIQVGFTFG